MIEIGLPVFRTFDGKKAKWKAPVIDLDKWVKKDRAEHLKENE